MTDKPTGKDAKQRTGLQNRSIHLYFKMLAHDLNKIEYHVMKTMRHDVPIPWTDTLVKELIWRKVQKIFTDKTSTTKLDTDEVSKIYEIIHQHIFTITKGEVDLPFPDRFR